MRVQAGFTSKPTIEIDVPAPTEEPVVVPEPAEPAPVEEPVPA